MSSIILLVDVGVGGDLDRGRRLAAIGRAAAGGEAEDVGAARHLAGRRDRIVAGRVHEHEALLGHRVGIVIDGIERRRAALGRRAERLLEDRRQPAELVAGRGIVVHLHVVAGGVVLPPVDDLDELLAHFPVLRAAGEQVLGAVDLRRLREDRRAAMPDQDVGRDAERRIGGDAGIAVRAAALQRQHQFRGRQRLAPRVVDDRQHGLAPPRRRPRRSFCVPPISWIVMVRNVSFSVTP